MSRELIEAINRKLSIIEVVENYLTLKRVGNRYTGLCPFHNEKTPSFTVTPDNNLFYCFGCHKGGDMINFVMEIENMDFQDALGFLAKKASISIENYSKNYSKAEIKTKQALKELYKGVVSSFSYILKNKSEAEYAMNYLRERGVTEKIIEEFQIGWAPKDRSWLYKFLKSRNFSDNILSQSGLFSKRSLNWALFAGRIMFPLKNQNGDVIGFSGRTLKDDEAKYINTPETILFKKKFNLFGLSNAIKEIRKEKYFILCEGQMDVIAYHQAGINNAIAPLGTAFTEEQAVLLKRYADKAVISFDGDKAGKKAMNKAIILCEKNEINTEVVLFKENEDPSDLLHNNGAEALNNILKSSINSFDYLLDNAIIVSNINTPVGKENVILQLKEYVHSINSKVRKEGCIREISDRLGVDYASVFDDIKRGNRIIKGNQQKEKPNYKKEEISPDLFLMIAVVVNREKFSYVRSKIDVNDLFDDRAKTIYIALEECFRNEETELESVLSRIADDRVKKVLAEKIPSEEYSINADEVIRDLVKKIKKSCLLQKREKIERKLRDFSRGVKYTNDENELLAEKIFIDQEINKLR